MNCGFGECLRPNLNERDYEGFVPSASNLGEVR